MDLEPAYEIVADGGEVVRLFDVVGGRNGELLDPMLAMHRRAFSGFEYARDGMRDDASAPPERDGVIVHQFVATVDDVVSGFSLVDTNFVRNVAPNHFLYVERPARSVTIDGRRLGTWFLYHTNTQIVLDGAPENWGSVCEADEPRFPIFMPTGWVVLDNQYDEPVHGWTWREHDTSSFRHNLLWLPRPGADVDALLPKVREAAAAAFLLDMYQLDRDVPLAARQCGTELDRPGAVRR